MTEDTSTVLAKLQEHVESHERTLETHSEAIDRLDKELTETKVHDQYRDQSIQRIEGKLDKQSGKMDSITLQIAQLGSKPEHEKAELWDRVKWYVLTLLIGAIVSYALMRAGLK